MAFGRWSPKRHECIVGRLVIRRRSDHRRLASAQAAHPLILNGFLVSRQGNLPEFPDRPTFELRLSMETMRAVRLYDDGLRIEQIPVPKPTAGEALVRVHAAAITRDELTWPVDRLPAIPSYELSGVVAEVAPDARDAVVGDEVFALTPFDRDGVAAEYAVVPAALLAPRPRSLTHTDSAALPLAGLSAWQGLFDHGALREGERVCVLGATGGVGHLAVQLARAQLAAADEPCDLVFDTVGGDVLARAVRSAPRVVSVAEEADGARYFIVEPSRAQLVELAHLADAGELRPAIDSVFPLDQAGAAFSHLAERGKRGKVVLRVAND
jgi:NADPH:quinone reductase-like Zn-dependent oxidoreductase